MRFAQKFAQLNDARQSGQLDHKRAFLIFYLVGIPTVLVLSFSVTASADCAYAQEHPEVFLCIKMAIGLVAFLIALLLVILLTEKYAIRRSDRSA